MAAPELHHDRSSLQQDLKELEKKLDILSLNVQSHIQYRYARTVVSNRVTNLAESPHEATFSMVLPETAFISGFYIEVDGEVHNAYVKEKEEAQKTYTEAVQQGRTAGHIAQSARDSNRFVVSVNVEAKKEMTFNLTYEELLTRKLGAYKHVVNLDPGQIVKDFNVEVHIQESSGIQNLEVTPMKTSEEIDGKEVKGDSSNLVTIKQPTNQSAEVKFAPNSEKQAELAQNGIKGQFIVKYDLDRTSKKLQQFLIKDCFFAHFFAPEKLKPLSKHVIFVLDVSGSMYGRKIEQLKEAMHTILNDLRKKDYFSLVAFNQGVQIWRNSLFSRWEYMYNEDSNLTNAVVQPNIFRILKAKKAISELRDGGGTDMYEALRIATKIAITAQTLKLGSSKDSEKPHPIIIFLTDGQPTNGVTHLDSIIADTTKWNLESKASIFSLALGNDADLEFLKKLSLRNSGIGIKIYEAKDTALQLRDFYRQVASPLVSDVTFNYHPEQVELNSLTKNNFVTFYEGTELIVAGRLNKSAPGLEVNYGVSGCTCKGVQQFEKDQPIIPPEQGPSFMERMWAYLKIKQLLDEEKSSDGDTAKEKKQEAINLALKYSFVTPVTSLVVVKPESKESRAHIEAADGTSSQPSHATSSGLFGSTAAAHGVPLPLPQFAFSKQSKSYSGVQFSSFLSQDLRSSYTRDGGDLYSAATQQSLSYESSAMFGSPGFAHVACRRLKKKAISMCSPSQSISKCSLSSSDVGSTRGFGFFHLSEDQKSYNPLISSDNTKEDVEPSHLKDLFQTVDKIVSAFASEVQIELKAKISALVSEYAEKNLKNNASADTATTAAATIAQDLKIYVENKKQEVECEHLEDFFETMEEIVSTFAYGLKTELKAKISCLVSEYAEKYLKHDTSADVAAAAAALVAQNLKNCVDDKKQEVEPDNLKDLFESIEKTVSTLASEVQIELKAKISALVSEYAEKNLKYDSSAYAAATAAAIVAQDLKNCIDSRKQEVESEHFEDFFETMEEIVSSFAQELQIELKIKIRDLVPVSEYAEKALK